MEAILWLHIIGTSLSMERGPFEDFQTCMAQGAGAQQRQRGIEIGYTCVGVEDSFNPQFRGGLTIAPTVSLNGGILSDTTTTYPSGN